MMWHEARKQEKIIRTVMVDVKKRAERRKDFYDKIKLDPIRFLRLYGSKAKFNIDPEIAIAAENPNTLMVWVGDNKTVIDRFDVRANLDQIDQPKDLRAFSPDSDEKLHERMCNYERYRCLVHNQFARINETNALNRIEVTEKYGEDLHKVSEKPSQSLKRKQNIEKAAIGYVYQDSDYIHNPADENDSDDDGGSIDSEPDLDMDLDIELDILQLSFAQQKELTKLSQQFGMQGNDYLKLMKVDKTQEEEFRTAKLLEEQKAQFHGRKSRRERKIFKEQRLKEKYMKQDPKTLTFGASVFHEEIYVGKHLLTPSPNRENVSKSRSSSPSKTSGKNSTKSRNIKASVSQSNFINIPTIHSSDDEYEMSRRRSRSRSPPLAYSSHNRFATSMTNSSAAAAGTTTTRRGAGGSGGDYNSYSVNRNKERRYYSRRRRSHSRDRIEERYREKRRRSTSSTRARRRTDYTDKKSNPIETIKKREDTKSPELPEEEVLNKKYYQSESEKSSSSTFDDSSDDDADDKSKSNSLNKRTTDPQHHHNQQSSRYSSSNNTIQSRQMHLTKPNPITSKFNPQELLKKQMELQLNRAYRADKKAEQEKQEKVEKERMIRENQLREMALQIKKRELDKLIREPGDDADDDTSTRIISTSRKPGRRNRFDRYSPSSSGSSDSSTNSSKSSRHNYRKRHRHSNQHYHKSKSPQIDLELRGVGIDRNNSYSSSNNNSSSNKHSTSSNTFNTSNNTKRSTYRR